VASVLCWSVITCPEHTDLVSGTGRTSFRPEFRWDITCQINLIQKGMFGMTSGDLCDCSPSELVDSCQWVKCQPKSRSKCDIILSHFSETWPTQLIYTPSRVFSTSAGKKCPNKMGEFKGEKCDYLYPRRLL
jgi:hypothetical protein